MAFDFKKEYKEFYMPKNRPEIVTVPPMNCIAVRGQGDFPESQLYAMVPGVYRVHHYHYILSGRQRVF